MQSLRVAADSSFNLRSEARRTIISLAQDFLAGMGYAQHVEPVQKETLFLQAFALTQESGKLGDDSSSSACKRSMRAISPVSIIQVEYSTAQSSFNFTQCIFSLAPSDFFGLQLLVEDGVSSFHLELVHFI